MRNLAIKYLFNEVDSTAEYYKQYTQPHIIEQLFVRLQKCNQCVSQGFCSHCGCDVPNKLLDLEDYCSETEEKILPKEEWDLIKIEKIKQCLQ